MTWLVKGRPKKEVRRLLHLSRLITITKAVTVVLIYSSTVKTAFGKGFFHSVKKKLDIYSTNGLMENFTVYVINVDSC